MIHKVSSRRKAAFQRQLLRWYGANRRRFSWRKPGRTSYQILVAEVMLRKTDARSSREGLEERVPKPWDH